MSRAARAFRIKRTSLAAGAVALAALSVAPSAQAAFSRNPSACSGTSIVGAGASFQANVHNNYWRTAAYNGFCAPAGGKGASDIQTYPGSSATGRTGSGYGRRIVGARTGDNADGSLSRNRPTGERFGGSDEPPTTEQIADMNRGTDASGDEGAIRTTPVSVGSLAVIVNFPADCTPGAGDLDPDGSGRIRMTNTELEQVWAGIIESWADVLDAETGAGCATQIKRVVRRDDSGSTFAFKDFLDKVNGSRGWKTTYLTSDTTTWPDAADDLIIPADDGGGGLRTAVDANDGAIGYLELSSARSIFRKADAGDDKYWLRTQNGTGNYADPAANTATGFSSSTATGANCEDVIFSGLPGGSNDPNSTLQTWSAVSGANTNQPTEYGICTLTYLLAFDDSADAYGNTADEEGKARTVKDYLTAILEQGQSGLSSVDQSPLPTPVLTRASAGVNAIDWCKDGCGQSSSTNNNTTTTTTGSQQGAAANPVQNTPAGPRPIVQISNLFTIRSVRTRGSDIIVTLRLPGAGRAVVTATTTSKRRVNRRLRNRRFTYARSTVQVAQAGDVSIRMPRSKRAKSELNRASGKRGATLVKVRFEPTGGQAKEQSFSRRITVRYSRR